MLGDNRKGQRPGREGAIPTVQTRLKVGSKSISTLQLLQTNVGQCAANMCKVGGNKELRATTREGRSDLNCTDEVEGWVKVAAADARTTPLGAPQFLGWKEIERSE